MVERVVMLLKFMISLDCWFILLKVTAKISSVPITADSGKFLFNNCSFVESLLSKYPMVGVVTQLQFESVRIQITKMEITVRFFIFFGLWRLTC